MDKFKRRFPQTKPLLTDISAIKLDSKGSPRSARWVSPLNRYSSQSTTNLNLHSRALPTKPEILPKAYQITDQSIRYTSMSQEIDLGQTVPNMSVQELPNDKTHVVEITDRNKDNSRSPVMTLAQQKERIRKSQNFRTLKKQGSESSLLGIGKVKLGPIKERSPPDGNRTMNRFIDGLILKGSLPTEASEFFAINSKPSSKSHLRLDPLPKKETGSLSLMKIVDEESTPGNSIIPEWMKGIGDFNEKYAKTKSKSKYPIPEILKMEVQAREDIDSNFVVKWLERIDLFMKFPYDLLLGLSHRLKVIHLEEGEILCKIGEPADCLYIVYDGALDVLIPDKDGGDKLILTAKAGELLGRQTIETVGTRTANLVAAKPTYVIVMYRNDYQEVSGEIKNLIRPTHDIADFVMKHSFLSQFSELRKLSFMNHLEFRKLYKNDVIYTVGDVADKFYFLMNGNILRQIPITVEKMNKWPTSKNSWKMYKKVLTYSIKLPLEQGEVFGISEFLNKVPRKEKLISEGDSLVLICSKTVFYETFEEYEIAHFIRKAEEDEKRKAEKVARAFDGQSKLEKIKEDAMAEALKHAAVSKTTDNPNQVAKVTEWKRALKQYSMPVLREKTLVERKEIVKNINSVYDN